VQKNNNKCIQLFFSRTQKSNGVGLIFCYRYKSPPKRGVRKAFQNRVPDFLTQISTYTIGKKREITQIDINFG
jgi:hypothetical protein